MQTKKITKKITKKLKKTYHFLSGKPRPTSMVALSLENAQAAYGSRSDVTIHHFFRKNDFALKPAQHLPEDASFEGYTSTFPKVAADYDAVLLDVRDPKFSFQYNHLVDDQNRPIYEARIRFDELPIQHEYLLDPPKIKGTVAYFSNTVPNQYGHWLQTQLPILLAYWETFGKENIDYYYVGECPIADFVEESFAKLGIRRDQIINYPCRADRSLIAMKYRDIDKVNSLRTGFELDFHSHQFMQKHLFQPKSSNYGRKLFVMRGNVRFRRELNMPAIKAALEPYGFEFITMERKTMQQEADIFGNADVIVSVHGSALHNTLFSRPGTKVVEIFPYDYFEASNYIITNYSGCEYHYMIGDPLPQRPILTDYQSRNEVDILVNPEKLIRLCREMGILSTQKQETVNL
jgi:hypothetical protein